MSMTAIGGPWSRRPWVSVFAVMWGNQRQAAGKAFRRRSHPLRTMAQSGNGVLWRFASSRQARIGHEVSLGVELLLAGGGLDARRRAVGEKLAALLVVLEVRYHDLIEDLFAPRGIDDRAEHLDPAVEIARHDVGRGNIEGGLRMRHAVTRAEAKNPAMLEEAADDRFDADVLRQPRHTRAQAADAAHHEFDRDAGAGSA